MDEQEKTPGVMNVAGGAGWDFVAPHLLVDLPDGWKNLVTTMFDEVARMKGEKSVSILRESWGSLEAEVLVTDARGSVTPAYRIICKYRELSQHTCRECGADGLRRIVGGNVQALCGECFQRLLDPHGKPATGTWLDKF